MTRSRRAAATASRTMDFAAGGWTLLILLVCLVPTSYTAPDHILLCILCPDRGAADFLLNVALFLPLGLFLVRRRATISGVVAVGFALSLFVELTQLTIPGRFSSLSDLVSNTTGAGLGALLGRRPGAWLLPNRGAGTVLAGASALAASAAILAPALLFVPSLPTGGYWGNWTPRLPGVAAYPEGLLTAEIQGTPLPSHRLDDPVSDTVREALRSGGTVDLTFVAAGPIPGPAPLFRIVTDDREEAMQVAVEGRDLLVRIRFRAEDLRLSRPWLRIRSALPATAGDTVHVGLRVDPVHGYEIRWPDGRRTPAGHSAAEGWTLLGSTRPGSAAWNPWLEALWLALLLLPVGWWSPPGHRTRGAFFLLPCLLAIGSAPLFGPLLPVPWVGYAAALAGFAAGRGMRALVATRWWTPATPRGDTSPFRSGGGTRR